MPTRISKEKLGHTFDEEQRLQCAPKQLLSLEDETALKHDEWMESALSVSEVTFKELSEDEIRQYAGSGECDDKAGVYAIQGRAARFIVELRGSYSGVMGLPLYETAQLLDRAGSPRERR